MIPRSTAAVRSSTPSSGNAGYKDGARQHGFDTYVTMGATASFSRFSVGANYRNGDRSLGQSGRFAFNTGINF